MCYRSRQASGDTVTAASACGDGRQSHRREKGAPAQVRRWSTAVSRVASTDCDGYGTPIKVLTTGANVPDISRALHLLDGYAPIAGRRGRPRRRFAVLLADKGYDSEAFRQALPRTRHRADHP